MKYRILEIDIKAKMSTTYGRDNDALNRLMAVNSPGMPYGWSNEHPSMDSALAAIAEHSEHLKYKTLTIIPIIEVDWEGKIG